MASHALEFCKATPVTALHADTFAADATLDAIQSGDVTPAFVAQVASVNAFPVMQVAGTPAKITGGVYVLPVNSHAA